MKFNIIQGGMARRVSLFNGITPEMMVKPISELAVRQAIAGALEQRDRIMAQRVEAKQEVEDLAEGLRRGDKVEARLQRYEKQALELAAWDLEQEALDKRNSSGKEVE